MAYEFNPLVHRFQKMTIDKWEAYIASEKARLADLISVRARLTALGAGLSLADIGADRDLQTSSLHDGDVR